MLTYRTDILWSGLSLMLRQQLTCRAVNNHLALVQVTYNILEEPLFQLLLGPHMLPVSPRYQMSCARFVGPLR